MFCILFKYYTDWKCLNLCMCIHAISTLFVFVSKLKGEHVQTILCYRVTMKRSCMVMYVLCCVYSHQCQPLVLLGCRHFLFKHGSGSSALFSAASQNYPLTSNTVYSPPPRPLPRSTFSRPMFTFNKPYKCCNWKCTALSATAITVTLALLLTYVIGKLGISPHLYYLYLLNNSV